MWLSAGVSPWMNYMQPKKLMLHTWGPNLKGKIASEKTLPGIKELWKQSPHWYGMLAREDSQWHFDQAQE